MAPATKPVPIPACPPVRILVVDDNESICAFLRHFFTLEGLPAEITRSPHVAWERFQTAPQDYALLLTDCEMPGMSGLELAKRVRKMRADLPMIIFSTSVAVEGPAHFATLGFTEALPKPVAIATLRAAIRNALPADFHPAPPASPSV